MPTFSYKLYFMVQYKVSQQMLHALEGSCSVKLFPKQSKCATATLSIVLTKINFYVLFLCFVQQYGLKVSGIRILSLCCLANPCIELPWKDAWLKNSATSAAAAAATDQLAKNNH